jgi:hypothetical protein
MELFEGGNAFLPDCKMIGKGVLRHCATHQLNGLIRPRRPFNHGPVFSRNII